MTVAELIKQLQVMKPDLPVMTSPIYQHDPDQPAKKVMNVSHQIAEVQEFDDQVCLWRDV
jgi:hypothetical protein